MPLPPVRMRMRGARAFRAGTWVVTRLPLPLRWRLALYNRVVRRLLRVQTDAGRGRVSVYVAPALDMAGRAR